MLINTKIIIKDFVKNANTAVDNQGNIQPEVFSKLIEDTNTLSTNT